jgi:hypothetical protein
MAWRSTIAAGITALGCAACGVGDLHAVDGGPGSRDAGDGGVTATSGITVEFFPLGPNGQPASDGEPLEFPEFRIDAVTIQLHHLQLIGDTAPSGDLVHDSRSLEFPTDDGARVTFAMAPPGLYSRLTFDVERTWAEEDLPSGFEGERLSVRVEGEAHIGNKDRRFDYTDDVRLDIDIDLDKEVAPGIPGYLAVALDIRNWFADVEWSEVDGRGGGNQPIRINMNSNPDVAESLRQRMPRAFRVRQ